jgi:hypothetical protein
MAQKIMPLPAADVLFIRKMKIPFSGIYGLKGLAASIVFVPLRWP